MSDWLFDLGNSRLKCAPLREDGSVGEVRAIGHDGGRFVDGWEAALPLRIGAAHVASVAPAALRIALFEALAARSALITRASTQPAWAGVRIAYARPERLGVDRFLAVLGARARGPQAWLVVGVGTALTVDLLDAGGLHRGGRIAPSPQLMRDALHRRARQLPAEGGEYVAFAADTGDALASGCLGAAVGLVGNSIAAAREALGRAPQLIVHGGGAAPLLAQLSGAVHAPALVLEGLARWARIDDATGPRIPAWSPDS